MFRVVSGVYLMYLFLNGITLNEFERKILRRERLGRQTEIQKLAGEEDEDDWPLLIKSNLELHFASIPTLNS